MDKFSQRGHGPFPGSPVGIGPRPRWGGSIAILKKGMLLALMFSACIPILPDNIQPLVIKFLGVLLIFVHHRHLLRRGETPAEVKLYFAFLLWAVVSAQVVATDTDLSMRTAWTAFQMGLVFWAASVSHQEDPDLFIMMFGVWGLGLVFMVLALGDPEAMAALKGSGERLSVMGMNPNGGGEVLVFAIFGALYLGQRVVKWGMKPLLLGSIPVFLSFLLFTGSRKMLVAAIILLTMWFVVSYLVGASGGHVSGTQFAMVLAMAVAALVGVSRWESTPMAGRWAVLREEGSRSRPLGGRGDLYKNSWELFLENPVAGVGLDNQALTISTKAHSDYMDVLASTGLVGGTLYFSIYLIALLRARRIFKWDLRLFRLDLLAFLTYALVVGWLMFGFTRYDDLLHLIIFGSFIGFLVAAENKMKALQYMPNQRAGSRAKVKNPMPRTVLR